jgi:hypothetical protein
MEVSLYFFWKTEDNLHFFKVEDELSFLPHSTPERKTPPYNHFSKSKNPNLRTELAGVLKLNQVGLDKAEQLHTSEIFFLFIC